MRREDQISTIERWVEQFRAQRTTLEDDVVRIPAEAFLSEERFQREKQVLFREVPAVACLSADVPHPGDHLSVTAGGVPVAVVRQIDGTVTAFLNACRHRAAPVIVGEGRSRTLQCGFHGWIYDLDGNLRNQPRSCQGFSTVNPDDLCLRRLPVVERSGIVLVRPEGGAAIDADAFFCGIDEDFRSWGLDKSHFFRSDRHVWRANWKLIAHTFLEQYHLFALHGKTVADIYPGHIMICDSFGPNLRMPAIRESAADLVGQVPPGSWNLLDHAGMLWMLTPGAIISHGLDQWGFWRITPLTAVTTMTEFRAYGIGDIHDEDHRKQLDAGVDLHLAAANGEDFTMCEAEQRALESGQVHELLIGRNEAGLIRYTKTLDSLLAATVRR